MKNENICNKNIQTDLFLENGKPMARTMAKFGQVPRLFNTKRAATNALGCWLLGAWHNRIDFEGQPEGPCPPDNAPDDRRAVAEFLKVVEAEIEFKNA